MRADMSSVRLDERLGQTQNRVGGAASPRPLTPPDMRVRIRRFTSLTKSLIAFGKLIRPWDCQ